MSRVQNPKTKHHFLPRLYLKGFADKAEDPQIWQYERGAQFCPAKNGDSRNPQRIPISRAAMIPSLYAYKDESGNTEYEKIENELEKLEKPHDNIIRKIRSKRVISQGEKDTFSCYIAMIRKRVPEGIKRSAQIAQNALPEIGLEITQNLSRNWTDKRTRDGLSPIEIANELNTLLPILDAELHRCESEIPYRYLLLGLLGPKSKAGEYISQMTWQFFVAPQYAGFVTSDNPVVFNESIGIRAPMSELIFPISTEVALVASNHKNIEGKYVTATPSIIREINCRIADATTFYLYAQRKLKNYVDILNNARSGYNQIYSNFDTSVILKPGIDFFSQKR